MNENRTIIVYVESELKYQFFKKFHICLKNKQIKLCYLTTKNSIYIKYNNESSDIYLIKRDKSCVKKHSNDRLDSLEKRLNYLNEKELNLAFESTIKLLTKLENDYNFYGIFIWGGFSIFERAILDYCKSNNLRKTFFELSNIPGKIQVDSEGVNNASSYDPISNDGNNENPGGDFFEWKSKYLETIEKNPLVQSASAKKINFNYLFDRIAIHTKSIVKFSNYGIIKSSVEKLFYKLSHKYFLDNNDNLPENYIFYPTQVSIDSQILFFGNGYNNTKAIQFASKYANSMGIDLVVKIHPAEKNLRECLNILFLKRKLGFILSNKKSTLLIRNSAKVITINSTIAFETICLNKPLKILGESQFQKYNSENLHYYVFKYLVNVDFWNDEEITENQCDEIFRRFKP